MRWLLSLVGHPRPVILYPVALVLGVLLAFAWLLIIVGIALPLFARLVGAD